MNNDHGGQVAQGERHHRRCHSRDLQDRRRRRRLSHLDQEWSAPFQHQARSSAASAPHKIPTTEPDECTRDAGWTLTPSTVETTIRFRAYEAVAQVTTKLPQLAECELEKHHQGEDEEEEEEEAKVAEHQQEEGNKYDRISLRNRRKRRSATETLSGLTSGHGLKRPRRPARMRRATQDEQTVASCDHRNISPCARMSLFESTRPQAAMSKRSDSELSSLSPPTSSETEISELRGGTASSCLTLPTRLSGVRIKTKKPRRPMRRRRRRMQGSKEDHHHYHHYRWLTTDSAANSAPQVAVDALEYGCGCGGGDGGGDTSQVLTAERTNPERQPEHNVNSGTTSSELLAHSSSSAPNLLSEPASLRLTGIDSTNDPAAPRRRPIIVASLGQTLRSSLMASRRTSANHLVQCPARALRTSIRHSKWTPQSANLRLLAHLVIVFVGLLCPLYLAPAMGPRDPSLPSSVFLASCKLAPGPGANSVTNGLAATTNNNLSKWPLVDKNGTSFYQDKMGPQQPLDGQGEDDKEEAGAEQDGCEVVVASTGAAGPASGGQVADEHDDHDEHDDYNDYGTYIIFESAPSGSSGAPADLSTVSSATSGQRGVLLDPSLSALQMGGGGSKQQLDERDRPHDSPSMSVQRVFFAAKPSELAPLQTLASVSARRNPRHHHHLASMGIISDENQLDRQSAFTATHELTSGGGHEHPWGASPMRPADYTNSPGDDTAASTRRQHDSYAAAAAAASTDKDNKLEPLNDNDMIKSPSGRPPAPDSVAQARRRAPSRANETPPMQEQDPQLLEPQIPTSNIITSTTSRTKKALRGTIDMQYSSSGPTGGRPLASSGAPSLSKQHQRQADTESMSNNEAVEDNGHHHHSRRQSAVSSTTASMTDKASLNSSSASSLASGSFNIGDNLQGPARGDNNTAQHERLKDLMVREPVDPAATSLSQRDKLAAGELVLPTETRARHHSNNGATAQSSPAPLGLGQRGPHQLEPPARLTNSIHGPSSAAAPKPAQASWPPEAKNEGARLLSPPAPARQISAEPDAIGLSPPLANLIVRGRASSAGGDDDEQRQRRPPRELSPRVSRILPARQERDQAQEVEDDQQLNEEDVKWLRKMNENAAREALAASKVSAGQDRGGARQSSRSTSTESSLSSSPALWQPKKQRTDKQSALSGQVSPGPYEAHRDKALADKSNRNKFVGSAAASEASAGDAPQGGAPGEAMSLPSSRDDANGSLFNFATSTQKESQEEAGAYFESSPGAILAWLKTQFLATTRLGAGKSSKDVVDDDDDDAAAAAAAPSSSLGHYDHAPEAGNSSRTTAPNPGHVSREIQSRAHLEDLDADSDSDSEAGYPANQDQLDSPPHSQRPPLWKPGGVNVTDSQQQHQQPNQPVKHSVYYWRLVWFVLPLGATFGNLLVILAVYRERSLQSVTNYFIVSLAFADLFVGLVVMPFAVYVLVNEVWGLSDLLCDIFVAVDVTSSTASILNLVAISIDRYLAIAHPIAYSASSSSTRAIFTICLVWLISCCVGAPIILGLNTTPERQSSLCILYNSTFIFWSSLTSFYVPCIIMIGLYWRIFSAIRSRTKKVMIHHQVGGAARAATAVAVSGSANSAASKHLGASLGNQVLTLPSNAQDPSQQAASTEHQNNVLANSSCKPMTQATSRGQGQSVQLRRSSKSRRQMQSFDESAWKSKLVPVVGDKAAQSCRMLAIEPAGRDLIDQSTACESSLEQQPKQSLAGHEHMLGSMKQPVAELRCEAIAREEGRRHNSLILTQLLKQEQKHHLHNLHHHQQCCPLHNHHHQHLRSVTDSDCHGLDDGVSHLSDSLCYNSRSEDEEDEEEEDDSSQSSRSSISSSHYDCSLVQHHNHHHHQHANNHLSPKPIHRLLSSAGNSPRALQRNSCCPRQHQSGSLVLASSTSGPNTNTATSNCLACERCFSSFGSDGVGKQMTSEQVTPTRQNHKLAVYNENSSNANSTTWMPNQKRSSVMSSTICCDSPATSTRCGHSLITSASFECTSGPIVDYAGPNGDTITLPRCAQCSSLAGAQESPIHIVPDSNKLDGRLKTPRASGQAEPIGMFESARQTIKRRSVKLTRILTGRSRENSIQVDSIKRLSARQEQVFNISGETTIVGAGDGPAAVASDEPTQSSSSSAGQTISKANAQEQHQRDCPVELLVVQRLSNEQSNADINNEVGNQLDLSNTNDNHKGHLSACTLNVTSNKPRHSLNPHNSDVTICEKSTTVTGTTSSSDKLLTAAVTTAAVAVATSNLNQPSGQKSPLAARHSQLMSSMINLMNKGHGRPKQANDAKFVHNKQALTLGRKQQQRKVTSPANKQEQVQQHHHHRGNSRRRREKNAARRERKATKTLAIVLGIFLICWTPFFTCNIIDGICIQLNMDCRPGMSVYLVTSWLGYINSCVNPIIYTIFNMEFRRAFKKILTTRPDCSGCR